MAEIYNRSSGAGAEPRVRWPLVLLVLAVVAALVILLALWLG